MFHSFGKVFHLSFPLISNSLGAQIQFELNIFLGSSSIDQLHAVFDLEAAKIKDQRKKEDMWDDFLSKVRTQGYNVDVNYLCFDEWEWEEK